MNSLSSQAELFGITLHSSVAEKLSQHTYNFLAKNKEINLSAIRDEAGVIEKHLIDSLILTKYTDLSGKRVLDVGTGGGFPGIPLACFYSEASFTLLDSIGKKVRVVQEFTDRLGLRNVTTIQARAEELRKQPGFRPFDVITSRATAFLPTLLEWTHELLAHNGAYILYKLDNAEEIEAGCTTAKMLGLTLTRKEVYELAGQKRALLFFEKRKHSGK